MRPLRLPLAIVCLSAVLASGCARACSTLGIVGMRAVPVQTSVTNKNVPIDGYVVRSLAEPLTSVTYVEIAKDETDTEAGQLLGDGTFYRLELDRLGNRGAALVRFDNVASGRSAPVRIPLIASAGEQIRADT